MASANPKVDQYIDHHDLEKIQVCEPHELVNFDEWYISHSLEQLMDVHSSIKLRWEVMHWIFTIPFVSPEYSEPRLRRILETIVDRFRQSVSEGKQTLDPTTCYSIKVPSLGLEEVAFNVTESFRVVPHSFSFEAVCIRLQVEPDVMRTNISYMMRMRGIDQLIENSDMAVRAKRLAPEYEQHECIDGVDYGDIRCFVRPISVPGLLRQSRRVITSDADRQPVTADLFK